MRGQLESSGVAFKRCNFKSLSELSGLGHDILINATGTGSGFLTDVKDPNVQQVRGQTILVRSNFDKIWIRRGVEDYTYALPRGDGTCILGGIKEFDNLYVLKDRTLKGKTLTNYRNLSPEDDRRQDVRRKLSHFRRALLMLDISRSSVELVTTSLKGSQPMNSELFETLLVSVLSEVVESGWKKKSLTDRRSFMRMVRLFSFV